MAGVLIGSSWELPSVSGAAMFYTVDNVVVPATSGGRVRGVSGIPSRVAMECGKLNSSLWVNRLLKSDLIYVLFMCEHYYTSQCEWTLKRTKTSVIDSFVNYKADILGTLNVP
jgi:hypothetical protein